MVVKTKTSAGSRSTVKSNQTLKPKARAKANDSELSHLSEAIISNVGVGIYIVRQGKLVYVSSLYKKLTGYSDEELLNHNSLDFLHPDDRETTRLNAIKVLKQESAEPYEYRFIRKTGGIMWVLEKVTSIQYQGEQAALGSFMDISERKQMEETIRQSEDRYRTIIEQMEDGYFETDLRGAFTFVNDAECKNLGYPREELLGMNLNQYMDKKNAKALYNIFAEIYKTGKPVKAYDLKFIRKNGSKAFNEISAILIRNENGEPAGFRGIARDITESKGAEERIQYLATHDGLTGLPNRVLFNQLINHTIQSERRYKRGFAVFFMDLDRFKIINDTLGHDAGDQLLQEIAIRLKQTLRAVDTVARLGGDEFVILIEEINDLSYVATVAEKILSAVIKPMMLLGEECRVTASIGVSIFPNDGRDEQSLMKKAEIAMYCAKEEGKNNFQIYSKDIKSQSIERLSIETNLRFALEKNDLFLHYQAKLDVKTGAITGVEALLRWNNPYIGSVTPTQFIPVAEETGLIVPIGRWVLQTACAQNVAWQRQGLPRVCMAVNLSIRQLTDDNLIADIGKALSDSGMEPDLLELEITESMVMQNPVRMMAVLGKIKKLGVRLSIDDFGTGYSSLAQIKHFPVDILKIDRSFMRDVMKNSEDNAITKAIIAMGKTLRLTVIAEGVETLEQLNFLRE
ncbi:MAG: EAL domain-containing protein, partial [Deltaproteobacteria bacterium]|nr:EAL domain-containing protein [Deltaproteobacteria bacterium]